MPRRALAASPDRPGLLGPVGNAPATAKRGQRERTAGTGGRGWTTPSRERRVHGLSRDRVAVGGRGFAVRVPLKVFQQLSGLLRDDVVDEGAHRRLRAGQVFELVGRAADAEQLQV